MRVFSLLLVLIACALAGCGHIVCETEADCPSSDYVCSQRTCIKKSAPRPTPPAECGDRCEPDRVRCDYGPTAAETDFQRCTVGEDGCSHWTVVEACGETKHCDEPAGCVPYLTEGASCAVDDACGPGLLCTSLEELSGVDPPTCRRACGVTACDAADRCVRNVCVPASFCQGCNAGDRRCGNGGAPEQCDGVDESCTRWSVEAACSGSDACMSGECVGTVMAGGACSPQSSCVLGLVCLEDSGRCEATCASSRECPATGCRPTRGSRGNGICAAGAGPRVEATCVVGIGSGSVSGELDPAGPFVSVTPPDPYVVISGGGYYLATGVGSDTAAVSWNVSTPQLPFLQVIQLRIAVWDDDSPFSPPDLAAEWSLPDQFAWDSAERSFTLSLSAPQAMLGVTVRCTDR